MFAVFIHVSLLSAIASKRLVTSRACRPPSCLGEAEWRLLHQGSRMSLASDDPEHVIPTAPEFDSRHGGSCHDLAGTIRFVVAPTGGAGGNAWAKRWRSRARTG